MEAFFFLQVQFLPCFLSTLEESTPNLIFGKLLLLKNHQFYSYYYYYYYYYCCCQKHPIHLNEDPLQVLAFRIATLCSLLPVKYCRAEPKLSLGTTRRSTSIPLFNRRNVLCDPLLRTSSTSGIAESNPLSFLDHQTLPNNQCRLLFLSFF